MFNKILLFFNILVLAFIVMIAITHAWTNPSGNPPSGGGALYYSGGKVGIGIASPAERLDLGGGNIKMGWERVVNSCSGVAQCTVYCSSGKYVLGGGGYGGGNAIYLSRPNYSGTYGWGWDIYVGSVPGNDMSVEAICADIR